MVRDRARYLAKVKEKKKDKEHQDNLGTGVKKNSGAMSDGEDSRTANSGTATGSGGAAPPPGVPQLPPPPRGTRGNPQPRSPPLRQGDIRLGRHWLTPLSDNVEDKYREILGNLVTHLPKTQVTYQETRSLPGVTTVFLSGLPFNCPESEWLESILTVHGLIQHGHYGVVAVKPFYG